MAAINLDDGARLRGTFQTGTAAHVTVQGGAGSAFNNNGDSRLLGPLSDATVGVDVIGRGTFTVGDLSFIEFAKSVGPNQSVGNDGRMTIDEPEQFKGSVTMLTGDPEVILAGLANADSYSFKNDLLAIWSGNKIIDRLRLTDQTQHGFVVEPPTASGSVNIVGITDPNNIPPGLPVHAWT